MVTGLSGDGYVLYILPPPLSPPQPQQRIYGYSHHSGIYTERKKARTKKKQCRFSATNNEKKGC